MTDYPRKGIDQLEPRRFIDLAEPPYQISQSDGPKGMWHTLGNSHVITEEPWYITMKRQIP